MAFVRIVTTRIRGFINDSARVRRGAHISGLFTRRGRTRTANYCGLSEWVKQVSLKIPQFLDRQTERERELRVDSICDNENRPLRHLV